MASKLDAIGWGSGSSGNRIELMARFDRVRTQSQLRLDLDAFFMSLYHDRSYQGFDGDMDAAEAFLEGARERLNENVIFRIVTTLTAKLAKQKPKPTVLTDGADWALQQNAKKLDKFIWGTMHQCRAYEVQRQSDLHMILCGTGFIHVTSRGGKIHVEAVPPWEIFCEAASARYGSPRTIFRRQFIDRQLLASLYPDYSDEIMRSAAADHDDIAFSGGGYEHDMVTVVTGWKLPSSEGAEDGMTEVGIRGCSLTDGPQPWNRSRFPFAVSRYALAPEGYFGVGATVNLVGQQLELNRVLSTRQTALRMLGASFIAVERGSKVVKSHLSDQIGRIVEFTGTLPQVIAPGTIHPETFQHSDRVKSGMFSSVGVSEMAAASMKPAGLNSGKALRAYADMQDDGLHDIMVRREQQIVDLAELILDEAESIAEDDEESDIGVLYVGTFGTERINFRDSNMDRNAFVLRVQPTSSLSTTLSGRLEDLQDLRDLGLVNDPDEMREMLQLADLDAAAKRSNSMRDTMREVIEDEILGKGKAITPEPSWDLKACLKLAVQTRLLASLRGCPEDRITLLRGFEKKCIYYINQAQAPQQQQAAPASPETQPMGMPDGATLPPEMASTPAPEGLPVTG